MRPIIDLNGFFRELELDEVLNTMFDSKLVQAGLAKNCCSRDQNGVDWSFLVPATASILLFNLSFLRWSVCHCSNHNNCESAFVSQLLCFIVEISV